MGFSSKSLFFFLLGWTPYPFLSALFVMVMIFFLKIFSHVFGLFSILFVSSHLVGLIDLLSFSSVVLYCYFLSCVSLHSTSPVALTLYVLVWSSL
ncbi:uncharacterized protein BX664DRAFT_319787 [Halteromyces radiatus]|uniref:uncharacterized protein n=1 Tax=Halteromyces radiatus TaxID=101107 RepID=UPI00221F409D|nr:uncharacterized protein BX664DRAFT_319787 [Halteromyces radiatus]KAI8098864.1 hypothetical protein BX664DRAFT_319787 [Halteromyces radiatus]